MSKKTRNITAAVIGILLYIVLFIIVTSQNHPSVTTGTVPAETETQAVETEMNATEIAATETEMSAEGEETDLQEAATEEAATEEATTEETATEETATEAPAETDQGAAADVSNLEVGTKVLFLGGPVYRSASASEPEFTVDSQSKCTITMTYDGTHPYHLISDDGAGVYGWVDAADMTLATE